MSQPTRERPSRRGDSGAVGAGILFLTILTAGLLAGVFADWSNTVMPGLGDLDDRTFVLAFRALDTAINNPLFLGAFTVLPLLICLCAALQLRGGRRPVLWWLLAALVCTLLVAVITFGVHLPLNDKIGAAGAPDSAAAAAAARADLDEASWTAWNTVRALAATASFGCLVLAYGMRGRRGHSVGGQVE